MKDRSPQEPLQPQNRGRPEERESPEPIPDSPEKVPPREYRPSAGAALVFALIIIAVAVLLISRGGGGGSARPNCDALGAQIIQLSETNNAGTIRPVILKLYEVELVSDTDTEVRCRADALLSTSVRTPIDFYWWIDEDGDPFIRYQDAE